MTDYKRFIHGLAENNINRVFLNSDEGKMLDVFTELFNHSQNEVRIFAGSLCNQTTNSCEYIEALSDFIDRNGKLIILLNSFNENEAKNSNLYKRLAYYQSEKENSVKIRTTDSKPYIIIRNEKQYVHLAIGDAKFYRLETDIDARTAICNTTDSETAFKYRQFFDKIWEKSSNKDLELSSIFDNKN